MRILLAALAAVPLASLPAAADEPPRFDLRETCRASATASPEASSNGCLRSENDALGTLRQRWADFGPDSKRQCSEQHRAGGLPSYVELLTCLELASGSIAIRPSSGEPATTGTAGRERRPPDVTPEASPDQRIDPKAVLGKPTGG